MFENHQKVYYDVLTPVHFLRRSASIYAIRSGQAVKGGSIEVYRFLRQTLLRCAPDADQLSSSGPAARWEPTTRIIL